MSNLVIGCNVFYHSSLSFICILMYSLCICPFYHITVFSKVCIVCYPVLLYFFIKVFSHSSFLCIVFLCISYIFSLSTTIRYFPKSSVCVILFFLYYSIVFLHPSIYSPFLHIFSFLPICCILFSLFFMATLLGKQMCTHLFHFSFSSVSSLPPVLLYQDSLYFFFTATLLRYQLCTHLP